MTMKIWKSPSLRRLYLARQTWLSLIFCILSFLKSSKNVKAVEWSLDLNTIEKTKEKWERRELHFIKLGLLSLGLLQPAIYDMVPLFQLSMLHVPFCLYTYSCLSSLFRWIKMADQFWWIEMADTLLIDLNCQPSLLCTID